MFYDFACNLQEYCLNRESGYYNSVRFFHDIFHSYAHKCSSAFKSTRVQGFETVNSEICEQFNSFLRCIKSSARQMSQTHFCFYLPFFLAWMESKQENCLSIEIKNRISRVELIAQIVHIFMVCIYLLHDSYSWWLYFSFIHFWCFCTRCHLYVKHILSIYIWTES